MATKGNKKYTGALKKQKVFNRTKQKQTQLFLQADKLNNHSVPPCHKAHMWESPTITLLKYKWVFKIVSNGMNGIISPDIYWSLLKCTSDP